MSCIWDQKSNKPFARNWLRFAALSFVLLCLGQLQIFAQSVSLTWNPSTNTNAVGYKIYFGGASGVYTNSFSIGTATNVMVYGLTPGGTYYFCATTLTASGTESAFSNEAIYVIPLNSTNSPSGPQPNSQPPTLDPIGNLSIYQNAGPQTVSLVGISTGTGGNSNVTVTAVSNDGGAIISTPMVSYTSASSSGTLTFTPVGIGTATVTVNVNNGGVSNNLVSQQFTVMIMPVSVSGQPPTLNAITNLIVYQNAGLQTVNLTGIGAGTSGNSTVTVSAVATDNGTIITPPTINYTNSNTTGALTFTPVGTTGTVMVMVTVNNGGANNNYISREFTVTVVSPPAGNQPPTLNAIGNLTVNQNAGSQNVNLTGIGPGSSGNSTVTVTAVSSDGGTIISSPTVNYASSSSSGTLTFTPTGGTGTATVIVTVNNGGANNNLVSQQFTVTVLPVPVTVVSEPPTLNAISNLTVYEGSGLHSVALTGIGSGSGGNSTMTISATSSGNGKVISSPVLNYSSPNNFGTLTFVPATNALGSVTVTVTVNNRAASNNIVTQTFTVTVVVAPGGNQLPTLNPIADVTLIQGPTAEEVTLTGITSGSPAKKPALKLTAISSNPKLIPATAIHYASPASTAVLTLRRVAAEVGTAIITVTANNDGKSNNIIQQSFTVTVVSNQPPTLNPVVNVTIAKNAGVQTIELTGITSGSPTENQVLKVTAASSNSRLISSPKIQYASPANTALLTFKPAANETGVATLTVTVNDGAWKNNVIHQSFTVTVTSASITSVTGAGSTAATLTTIAHDTSSGRFSFQVTGVASGKYVVQGTSDLIHWTPLQTNTVPFTYQDSTTSGSGQRFYRALYLQ